MNAGAVLERSSCATYTSIAWAKKTSPLKHARKRAKTERREATKNTSGVRQITNAQNINVMDSSTALTAQTRIRQPAVTKCALTAGTSCVRMVRNAHNGNVTELMTAPTIQTSLRTQAVNGRETT